MNRQLEEDGKNIRDILNHTVAVAEKYFVQQDSLSPGRHIADIPMDTLPEQGMGAHQTLEFFQKTYSDKISNSAGPRYFGFVTGGSTPAAVAGDWLVSAYDQNACGSNDSIAPQIEHQTIHFFKQFFGLGSGFFGSFVTGATMANFVGLSCARQWVGEQYGIDSSNEGIGGFPLKVISATPHSSVIKSLSMLGIGRNALIKIDTGETSEAIDINKLENFLRQNPTESCIVVANAGTVNTGDFDDLVSIGRLKKNYNFWMHVDGAFGGFAACSEKYRHLMNGVNEADSITIDAHKWLNVPYDAAMQFTRHKDLQLKVFQNNAAYLGDALKQHDFFHYTPETSRRWRALPSWFTLMAYGKQGHREIFERNCSLATEFGDLIRQSGDFILLQAVKLNIVCFTFKTNGTTFESIEKFLVDVRESGEVFFTPTVYKGTAAIRAALSNWKTERKDIKIAFDVITKVRQRVLSLEKKMAV
jgi:glutamate/tyrosine decarboxylase-like PLP-dependent enzyme